MGSDIAYPITHSQTEMLRTSVTDEWKSSITSNTLKMHCFVQHCKNMEFTLRMSLKEWNSHSIFLVEKYFLKLHLF